MVQVKVIMITSSSSPQSYFGSMHSQEQDLKEMSKIYYKRFDAVFIRATRGIGGKSSQRASKGQGTRHSQKC
jgi:hypothetical protein